MLSNFDLSKLDEALEQFFVENSLWKVNEITNHVSDDGINFRVHHAIFKNNNAPYSFIRSDGELKDETIGNHITRI